VPASAAPATTTPTTKPTSAPTPAAPATPVTALDVTSTIDGFSGAVDVAATGDAVWVLDHSDSSLWPIDPATATLGKPIDVASSGGATYLELVDGLLWVAAQDSGDVVGVDPAKGKVVRRVPVGGLDGGVMTAGDGAIWVIRAGGQDAVRVDPKAGKVTATLPLPAACGNTPLAAGGFLWIGNAGTGHLCKLDPASGAVLAELDGVGAPMTLGWGAGRIWSPTADGGIVIVDPAGPSVEATLAAPEPGEFQGGKYALGFPDENASIVGDETGAWVRYTHGILGRVNVDPEPAWTLYAGLRGAFIGSEANAFDSLWIADTEQVLRAATPAS